MVLGTGFENFGSALEDRWQGFRTAFRISSPGNAPDARIPAVDHTNRHVRSMPAPPPPLPPRLDTLRSEGSPTQSRLSIPPVSSVARARSTSPTLHESRSLGTPQRDLRDVHGDDPVVGFQHRRLQSLPINNARIGGSRDLSRSSTPPSIAPKPSHIRGWNMQSALSHSAADKLPTWLRKCKSLHGDACRPANHPSCDKPPRFLIDLRKDGQIIDTKQGTSYVYVALSYHRAEKNGVKLTKVQKAELRHCKVLFQHPLLPQIVHETMEFVRDVGETYLWIDFLCLAHDDDDILEEMKRMDKIYAGALFTMIAACETGLYGPKPERAQAEPISYKAPQHTDAGTMKDPEEAMAGHYRTLLKSIWATRGWTFQERMFSTRAIVFIPESVPNRPPGHCFFWECECAMWDNWHLTPSSAPTVEKESALIPSDPMLYRPDATTDYRIHFARYFQTIYYYNNREFRNGQDVLRAISGCLRKLTEDFESFESGFICGLPRRKFHESLLWQPLGTSTRRQCRCDNHGESPHQVLPSWSWCGWQCDLDLRSIPIDQRQDLNDFEKMDHFAWETEPVVEWKILKDGKPKALGLSWSRSPKNEEQCDLALLTCEAYTADLFVREVHTPPQPIDSGMRKALQVKVPIGKMQSTQSRQVAALENADGTWAGVLGLMWDLTSKDTSKLRGSKVKLVAISKGSVSYDELRKSHEERTDKLKSVIQSEPERNNPLLNGFNLETLYRFYNVLWVEEKNGHFSRKALGRVKAKAWEDLSGKQKSRIVLR